MKAAFQRLLLAFAALAIVLSLGACSLFGWGSTGTATMSIVVSRPSQPAARVASGAGGTLQIPDFSSYQIKVSAPDIDPIVQSGALPGTISVKVPYGANRRFDILAYTAQVRFTGTYTVATVDASTTNVPITLALDDVDLMIPVVKVTTGRLVRYSYTTTIPPATPTYIDNLASSLRDPALAAYTGPSILPAPFNAGDSAYDAEGFVYLSENTNATVAGPRIVKIRDATSGTSIASDIFYIGTKASDSTAGVGISSIAVDQTLGNMYFCRGGERWFYKKSLKLLEGAVDQREVASRVNLAGARTIVALSVAADGSIFALVSNTGIYYLEKYAADPAPGSTPTATSTSVATIPAPVDVQAIGTYVYVLNSSGTGNVIQRFDPANLATAPTTGGNAVVSVTTNGNFSNPTRFLTGPKGTVYVKVNVSGSDGFVSFTDIAGFIGWTYVDIGGPLP
jgi:hypothetical protein